MTIRLHGKLNNTAKKNAISKRMPTYKFENKDLTYYYKLVAKTEKLKRDLKRRGIGFNPKATYRQLRSLSFVMYQRHGI